MIPEVILDIGTVALIVYCIITQIQWLGIYKNGARNTEKLFLLSLIVLLLVACTYLAYDIFHFNTTVIQRALLFVWGIIACYFYRGKTFEK